MTLFSFIGTLFAQIFKSQLNSFVAIVFQGFLLQHYVRQCFNDCDRNQYAIRSEYLRHAKFTS